MPKGYWVAFADVSDPEGYKAYIAENAKAFRKYGGRFLTRGGPYEAPEGKPRSRAVVIEFPSMDKARAWYFSDEYQAIVRLRTGNSDGAAFLISGVLEGYRANELLRKY